LYAGLFLYLIMRKILFVIMVSAVTQVAFAQQETTAIKHTINNLFDGMRKGDSIMLRSVFAKTMVLQSVSNKADGTAVLAVEKADDFVKAVGTPHKGIWDERVVFETIKIDGDLASVWAPYKFYLDGKFSHCGVDVFQLMKTAIGWKIIYIVDTRRTGNCVE
jgi:hypothetical protein